MRHSFCTILAQFHDRKPIFRGALKIETLFRSEASNPRNVPKNFRNKNSTCQVYMKNFYFRRLILVFAFASLCAFAQPPGGFGGGMGGGSSGGSGLNDSEQKGPPQNQDKNLISRILSAEILQKLNLTQDQLEKIQYFEKKEQPVLMKIHKDEEKEMTNLASGIFTQNEKIINDAMVALKDVYQEKLNFQEKEVQFLMTILDPDQNRKAKDYYFSKLGY